METSTASSRQIRNLNALLELSKAMAKEIRLEELLPVIMERTTEVLEADRSTLFLYDEERDELWSLIAQGLGDVHKKIRIPADVGLAGHVARSRETLNIADAYEDERFNRDVDHETGYRTRSMLSRPIENGEGGLVGIIQVLNKQGGTPFSEEDESLLAALTAHAAVALERARLVESYVEQQRLQETLQLAHNIQMGLLPKQFPPFPERKEFDIYASMVPAKEVGGDFYDFFMLDEHRLGIAIGDVSGKGVPAAIFMAVTRTLLKATAMRGLPPDECIEHVNRMLARENEAEMFVTIFYGILDPRTGLLQYCNAGHNDPCILRPSGEVGFLPRTNGLPVCVLDDYSYDARHVTMRRGDSLVLYTDGVTEAQNERGTMFGTPLLRAGLQLVAGAQPEGVIGHLVDEVSRFQGTAAQWDDVTVLAVKYHGPTA